jgi:hypothetical protein
VRKRAQTIIMPTMDMRGWLFEFARGEVANQRCGLPLRQNAFVPDTMNPVIVPNDWLRRQSPNRSVSAPCSMKLLHSCVI